MSDDAEGRQGRPVLRIIRGEPDDVELAALTAVLASLPAAAPPVTDPEPARSGWADRAASLRRPLFPGPDAWRRSGL
ncbi:Ser/Thr protein kinase RdoA (MazF antagonist) [Actinoalloteichus hoggarensis]|uniref:Uncharacterized protein n=1 Tax=Actinoalloteichus hoggarensis TaxID=1470176 RepID=A0A221WAN4_9PSEU|nr:acyl-CoA carboxylase subunit epsilon [Actinoalloteichus hoggarensis]ASO22559.1 hypothetical protein AHOG_24770 [Actinoalloteichus hoggarensis]MBB5923017.1 Ser/Thr protein kinase RdoA (MazF antagonist) [Actinoalloteichus hoggarensis]